MTVDREKAWFIYRCAECGETFSGGHALLAGVAARVVDTDEWNADPYCEPCWRERGGAKRG